MAIYSVTPANWNSAAFWSAISEGASGHTLDFSGLTNAYSVTLDVSVGSLVLSDGASTYTIGDTGFGGSPDVFLGGTTMWNFFTTILGTDGDDSVDFTGIATAVDVDGATGNDSITGGTGADTINGGADNDTIDGGAGDDSIVGGLGTDVIDGGAGNDTLISGGQNTSEEDTISGGSGNDSIVGGNSRQLLIGGDGNDTITGGYETTTADRDTILGGDGDDLLISGFLSTSNLENGDSIDGGSGNDTLVGGNANDTLIGGTGNDSLDGGSGDDSVIMADGFGTDTLVGGEGGTDADTVDFSSLTSGVRVTFSGDEAGIATRGTDTLTFSEIENFTLTSQADSVDGTASSADMRIEMVAGSGRDTIRDGSGDDTIIIADTGTNNFVFLGAGDDSVDSTSGRGDTYLLNNFGYDTITGDMDDYVGGYALSQGISLTFTNGTTASYGYGANTATITNINYFGGTNYADTADFSTAGYGIRYINWDLTDTVTGSAFADNFFGYDNSAFDLDMGTGDDYLSGGGGDDTVVSGTGDDTVFGGKGADILYGNDGADNLEGWRGDDTLYGGGGADSLEGHHDADTFIIENGFGADTIVGGETTSTGIDSDTLDFAAVTAAGMDVLFSGDEAGTASDGADTLTFSQIEALSLTAQADTVDAGAATTGVDVDAGGGDDSVLGGSGNDILVGGAGGDTLFGNAGDDTLTGGAGDDTFTYSVGDGDDTITDFNTGNTGMLNDGDNTNNDFINLSAFYDHISELYADQADDGILNQSNATDTRGQAVDYSDNSQFGGGSLTFSGASANSSSFTAENTAVVCFADGTLILTDRGEIPIENLRLGDKVVTKDNGSQEIVWIGSHKISQAQLRQNSKLSPIWIAPEVTGGTSPLIVSRQHGVLLKCEGEETLIRAAHLARLNGGKARIMYGRKTVTYYHLMFESHQIIFANGAPAESLFPGEQALAALDPEARTELFGLFPDLNVKSPNEVGLTICREFTAFKELPDNLRSLAPA